MTSWIYRVFGVAVLGAIVLGAAGCIRDDIGKLCPEGPAKGKARIEFTLDFPSESTLATRAEGEEVEEVFNEDEIHDLSVLVFHKHPETNLLACVDRIEVPVNSIEQSADYKAFAIDYTPDEPDDLYAFMVFANLDSALDALPKDYYNEYKVDPREFYSFVTFEIPDGGLEYLPMWGTFVEAYTITSTTKIPTIQMLRSVARIDLEIAGSLTDMLRLGPNGVIVPYSYATNYSMNIDYSDDSRKVNSPAYSESEELRATPLTFPTVENANAVTFYIGEYSYSADNEFCMLLNAKYGVSGEDTDVEGWYKVLLRDKQGGSINILRNHRYVVTITGVTGPGTSTPEEALNGSAYIQATVTPWNEAEQNVLFDGQHYLEVSESAFTIYKEAGNTSIEAMAIVPDDCRLTWSLDRGAADVSDISATETKKETEPGEGPGGTDVYRLSLNLAWAANAELEYDATLTFTAGNMNYVVKIHHSTDSWITFNPDSYYLLDGKFHEMGITATDDWGYTGVENVTVDGTDYASFFSPVNTTSAEMADKLMFSTDDALDLAGAGVVRLTFQNISTRTYTDPTKTVDITLNPPRAAGMLAPPGVIGYIKGTSTLTLKGSKEYANAKTPDSNGDGTGDIEQYAIDNFGGLSDSTVYVAYFELGSLVALSSDPTDAAYSSEESLELEDIVAAPSISDGYIGLDALRANVAAQSNYYDRFNQIPSYLNNPDYMAGHRDISAADYNNAANIALGKGDPCQYWFGTKYGDSWSVPSGEPYNGTPSYSQDNMTWYGKDALAVGLPNGWMSNRPGETGMFYSATGARRSDGSAHSGNGFGYYWSYYIDSNVGGHGLTFSATDIHPVVTGGYHMSYQSALSVRCVPGPTTISVSPTSYTFPDTGDTDTFTVTKTYFDGEPTISQTTDTDTWLTTSLENDVLTVTATPNTSGTTRTSTITLSHPSIRKTATVEVKQLPIRSSGTLAPPGVIGYIKGTNTLTIRGSKEYETADGGAVAAYARTIDPEGLENETVYVAYFKFGSLVALSSDPVYTTTPYIDENAIIAQPTEYESDTPTTWAGVPVYQRADYESTLMDISLSTYHNETNFKLGKGDPCMYYFGNNGGWKLPDGNPYNGYTDQDLTWKTEDEDDFPAVGMYSNTESGVFYPAAGRRGTNGQLTYHDDTYGSYGFYWSNDVNSRTNVHSLYFYSSVLDPSNTLIYSFGLPVRCVRE